MVDRWIGQMLFIVLDVNDDDVRRIWTVVDETAAGRDAAVPLIYVVQSDSSLTPGAKPQRKYRLDVNGGGGGALTTDVVSQFIRDVLDGKIKVCQSDRCHTPESHLHACEFKLASFHDADTDTDTDILVDILARIVARMSACRSDCRRNNSNRACRTCRRRGMMPA